MKLYDDLKKQGIDPFKKFVGERYDLLIPLNDLENFTYTPSYKEDYEKLGILELTYAVNPDMYTCMYILNKLAPIFNVKFRVMEAWRPFEIQLAKYEAEQKRNPGSTLFAKPDKNSGIPHVCGGAVDLLMTDKEGNPVQQPKWLLRKKPELIKQIRALNEDFKNVNNPFFTTHIDTLCSADPELKISALNVDILRKIVSSIRNLRHINDENWHFQLSDRDKETLPSYKNISITDVKAISQQHLKSVKKEVSDFAEKIFGIFYRRPFNRGTKHNYTDFDFDEKNIITLEELKQNIFKVKSLQQKILDHQKTLPR